MTAPPESPVVHTSVGFRRLAGRGDKEQRTVWSQRDSCVQDRSVQGAQELHGVDVGSNKVGPKSCKIKDGS